MSHNLINTEEFSYGHLISYLSFARAQTVHSIPGKEHPGDSKNNNQLSSKTRKVLQLCLVPLSLES